MTLTREPSGRRASQIRAGFVDAPPHLSDDPLANRQELGIVTESDFGFDRLAAHFDEGLTGTIDHDIGNIIAREQRLQRSIAKDVIADIVEQFLLLGDRHREVLDRDDVIDDIANFFASAFRIWLGQLRQIRSYRSARRKPATSYRSSPRCGRVAFFVPELAIADATPVLEHRGEAHRHVGALDDGRLRGRDDRRQSGACRAALCRSLRFRVCRTCS
ncbi:hypothetical protein [Ensifer canadensis]